MSEWRPEGWANPFIEHQYGITGCRAPEMCGGCDFDLFESGADAMVVALTKDSEHLLKADVSAVVQEYLKGGLLEHGTWVFIPDEE